MILALPTHRPAPQTVQRTIRLHRIQAAFRRSKALHRAFVAGRGAGKSWIGAYDLCCRAKTGRLYFVGAPTYPMLADSTLRTFLKIGRDLGIVRAEDVRLSPPSVRLTTGAEILFRSLDNPERARGPNLSGAWIDEGSLVDQEALDIILACLREEGQQGWLSLTYTPKGRTHWTYRDFVEKPRPDFELFRARTKDNPYNPPGFYERLVGQYGERSRTARQELEGEFLDAAGAEWPGDYFPESIWFDAWPEKLVWRVLALDPSKGKDASKSNPLKHRREPDYSAYVMLGLDDKGHLWIDADLDNRRDVSRIIEDGLNHCRAWRPNGFVVETNQFQELIARDLIRLGKARNIDLAGPYGIVNRVPKKVRIRSLGPYLARGEMHFRRGSHGAKLLVQQLQDFPQGQYDDGPDALEMGVRLMWHLIRGRRGDGQEPEIVRV